VDDFGWQRSRSGSTVPTADDVRYSLFIKNLRSLEVADIDEIYDS